MQHRGEIETLKKFLRSGEYSMTTPRRLVFEELSRGPLSNAHLAKLLAKKADRASVYRTVSLFEELGVIKRNWIGSESEIELSEAFIPHHHHTSCRACGASLPFASDLFESLIDKIAEESHFALDDHRLELLGTCRDCQTTSRP